MLRDPEVGRCRPLAVLQCAIVGDSVPTCGYHDESCHAGSVSWEQVRLKLVVNFSKLAGLQTNSPSEVGSVRTQHLRTPVSTQPQIPSPTAPPIPGPSRDFTSTATEPPWGVRGNWGSFLIVSGTHAPVGVVFPAHKLLGDCGYSGPRRVSCHAATAYAHYGSPFSCGWDSTLCFAVGKDLFFGLWC